MSVLRHAARRAAQLNVLRGVGAPALGESAASSAALQTQQQSRQFTCSSSCRSPTHIEDELYCRQRQLLVLGNRVPVLSPDSWVAPNAVVIGDVDLFDKVSDRCCPPFPSCLALLPLGREALPFKPCMLSRLCMYVFGRSQEITHVNSCAARDWTKRWLS